MRAGGETADGVAHAGVSIHWPDALRWPFQMRRGKEEMEYATESDASSSDSETDAFQPPKRAKKQHSTKTVVKSKGRGPKEEDYSRIFTSMDSEQKGSVSAKNIKDSAVLIGMELTDEMIIEMIYVSEQSPNTEPAKELLNLDEFIVICKKAFTKSSR